MSRTKHAGMLTFTLLSFLAVTSFAQRHERKAEELADSEKIQNVSGGVTFQVPSPISKTYDDLLNYVKREGLTIDSASKETGQIVTGIEVSGKYHQTGTRIYLTVMKDNDMQTSVRVAVSEQKRYKALQTEPWASPKVNAAKSAELSEKIKGAIKA
jgi:hypothetical protein